MQQVDLYCKKRKKSMKMSYMVSGDKDAWSNIKAKE